MYSSRPKSVITSGQRPQHHQHMAAPTIAIASHSSDWGTTANRCESAASLACPAEISWGSALIGDSCATTTRGDATRTPQRVLVVQAGLFVTRGHFAGKKKCARTGLPRRPCRNGVSIDRGPIGRLTALATRFGLGMRNDVPEPNHVDGGLPGTISCAPGNSRPSESSRVGCRLRD